MDQEEFVARTEAVKARLYRTAYLYLGREADALEAVDEAVYQALRALRQLRQEEYFEYWLTRILINLCKDELKRRDREITTDSIPEVSQEYLDTLPLKEAVSALPEDLKAVIILRYFTGLTLEETASALEIPRGTVSTRQKRALELLRLDLEEKEVGI